MTTQPTTPQPQDPLPPEQRVSKLEGINEQILQQLHEWRAETREQFAQNRADHERLRAEFRDQVAENHAEHERLRAESRAEYARLDKKIDDSRAENHAEFARLDTKVDDLRKEMRQEIRALSNRMTVMVGLTLITIIGALVGIAIFPS